MVKFVEIEAKSVLQKQKFRDNWFWNRYNLNHYRGCQFACNYCDAITEKYLVHKDYKDFTRIIYIKRNAPEVLEKEVETLKPDVVAMSGVTDPYQPAEKKYELTRKILESLAKHKFPVHIITKSDLVLRDIDLLREIAEQTWCTVSLTIITFDKELLPYLEPFAPSPGRRLKAVEKLNEGGVQAGVDFTPIVPYLLDGPENIDVANHLLLIAFFKEFKSANPYSAWAYHKASQTIEDLNESITGICKRKALEKLPGVGKTISKVIEEFLGDAKSERLEKECL